ncbi:DUF5365 family protein [Peribacillus kribbensis]|uniref:DUF5365 family protein n=1 Tax=Peribacillus kribbensis TaxID=356658 RepID=UPI0003FD1AF5|nr:DUF5365 family protein [Peribacillus kribbensis]
MRVVYASTTEQEQEIAELVQFFYESVFPLYFTKKDIMKFKEMGVLQTTTKTYDYFGTLKDAFHVMTSLNVILTVLEKKRMNLDNLDCAEDRLEELFFTNASLLNKYGIYFPLSFDQFSYLHNPAKDLNLFTAPANQLLI